MTTQTAMIVTELKSIVTRSRLDQQQSSWMSQRRVLPEDERRGLRIWMRRKQRERLAVYQKHRESLRERERKPFSTSGTVVRYVCLFTGIDVLCVFFFKNIKSTLLFTCYAPVEYNKQESSNHLANQRGKRKVCTCLHCLCTGDMHVHNCDFPFDLIGSCFWNNTTRGPVKPVLWPVTFPPLLQLYSFLHELRVHQCPQLHDPTPLHRLVALTGIFCNSNLTRVLSH